MTSALLVKTYYDTATIPQEASISIISGTALVRGARDRQWSSMSSNDVVKTGDSIMTNESSQVFVRLFDGSTVQVLTASEVRFKRMSLSRKDPEEETIELEVVSGKAHMGVAFPYRREKKFVLDIGTAQVFLSDGSYAVAEDKGASQLRVGPMGYARVVGAEKDAVLLPDQRLRISKDGVLGAPQVSWEEIVFNGDLSQGLNGWQQGGDLSRDGKIRSSIYSVIDADKPAVHFVRTGSKSQHGETYIYQEINRDVSDLSELRLASELRIISHALSGGGYIGSEYPVIVRLNYRTAAGDRTAGYGFYTHNEAGNRTDNGEQVTGEYWIKSVYPANLMALDPPPQKILSIQIGASGWDYESMVRGISLTGK
ncbi:MAG: hypothetical protein EXR50_06945 [Dehalococcoidia bacterium]|nr:hypothetical protein [Dehalococcoidia bacterium]